MYKVAKREEIEAWMGKRGIDILAIQETHIPTTHKEKRSKHTWYFSGEEKQGDKGIHAGVAIVVKNELRNYVTHVTPINDRIMHITLRGRKYRDLLGVRADRTGRRREKILHRY